MRSNNVLKKYEFNPEEWECYGQWEQPTISGSYWVHWLSAEILNKIGIKKMGGGLLMINGFTVINKKDLECLKSTLMRVCEKRDDKFMKNFIKVGEGILKNYLRFSADLEKNTEMSAELFEKFVIESEKVMVPWYIGVIFSDYMGDIISEKAQAGDILLNDIFDNILQKKTIMIDQLREVTEIKKLLIRKKILNVEKNKIDLKKLKEDKNILKNIRNHVKKYEWVGTHHFWGDPLSVEKFLEEITSQKEEKKQDNKKEIPAEFKFISQVASSSGYIRQYSAEIFDIVAYKARPLLDKIASKLNCDYGELIWLSPREIIDHLKKNTKPSKEDIKRRKRHYCIFLFDKQEVILDKKDEYKIFKNVLTPTDHILLNEFKGATANKGCAKGKAKIFLIPENLSKMKTGDILVTTMTTPDFVPMMKKAAAIITDVGGLLSHAAIVSRELGKPCIIGTKIATRILKDGDLVEVDADQGIVKILKK